MQYASCLRFGSGSRIETVFFFSFLSFFKLKMKRPNTKIGSVLELDQDTNLNYNNGSGLRIHHSFVLDLTRLQTFLIFWNKNGEKHIHGLTCGRKPKWRSWLCFPWKYSTITKCLPSSPYFSVNTIVALDPAGREI